MIGADERFLQIVDRSRGGNSAGRAETSPPLATEAEQAAVDRRRTTLPAGLTEAELLEGYCRSAAEAVA